MGKLAHICIVHGTLLRSSHYKEPRSFYAELGSSAERGFVREEAMATISTNLLQPPVLLQYQGEDAVIEQGIRAGSNTNTDPRREATMQAFDILSDKNRRELYDAYLVPIFDRDDPFGGLKEFCEMST